MSTPIHPAATGFDRVAARYDRGRPGYPPEALDFAFDHAGLGRRKSVLEVGAGSGKLSHMLADRVRSLTLVEPLEQMREILAGSLPEASIIDGTAEAVPVPDGSVDAVFAAQAFHWFDPEAALGEFHRVLKRRGRAVLIWNVRLDDAPVNSRVSAIIEPLHGDVPRYATTDWSAVLRRGGLFGAVEMAEVPYRQTLDEAGFMDRFMSVSWVASLPAEIREGVREDLAAIYRDAGDGGAVTIEYNTRVYVARRR